MQATFEGVMKVAWQCHPDDTHIPGDQARLIPIGYALMTIVDTPTEPFDYGLITCKSDTHDLEEYADKSVTVTGTIDDDDTLTVETIKEVNYEQM